MLEMRGLGFHFKFATYKTASNSNNCKWYRQRRVKITLKCMSEEPHDAVAAMSVAVVPTAMRIGTSQANTMRGTRNEPPDTLTISKPIPANSMTVLGGCPRIA